MAKLDEKATKQAIIDIAKKFESDGNYGSLDDLFHSRFLDSSSTIEGIIKQDINERYTENSLIGIRRPSGVIIRVDKRKAGDITTRNLFNLDYIKDLKPDTIIISYKVRIPSIDSTLPVPHDKLTEEQKNSLIDTWYTKDYLPEYANEVYNVGDRVKVKFSNYNDYSGAVIISNTPRFDALGAFSYGEGYEGVSVSSFNFSTPGNPLPEPQVAAEATKWFTEVYKSSSLSNKPDRGWGLFSQKVFDYTPEEIRGLYSGWVWNISYDDLFKLSKNVIKKEKMAPYSDIINYYSKLLSVDHRAIRALIFAESSFVVSAASEASTAAGAKGLTMYTPDGVADIRRNYWVSFTKNYRSEGRLRTRLNNQLYIDTETLSLDPDASILMACLHYSSRLKNYKDVTRALASHNSGDGPHQDPDTRTRRRGITLNEAYKTIPAQNKEFITKLMFFYSYIIKELK